MIEVAVSGAAGRMGSLVCEAVDAVPDMKLVAAHDPAGVGAERCGVPVTDDVEAIADADVDVVVEFTNPDVVLDNLAHWHRLGVHAVVGTSGFGADRIEHVRDMWTSESSRCLIVPNFSIGAVTMMRLAEIAAPHFAAAEVIELHHDRKADAPSGTAIATAERISAAASQHREVDSRELLPGARGSSVAGVPVHAVRLSGLVAHQEVLLGNPGEWLTIRHDTTDRTAFIPGVLLGIRSVAALDDPVTVGLEGILGLG